MTWADTTSTGFGAATSGTFYIRIGTPPPPIRQVRQSIHPCAVLGVSCGAPLPEVKKAYLRLAKENHPDAGSDEERAERTKKMALINHAYDLLVAHHRQGAA